MAEYTCTIGGDEFDVLKDSLDVELSANALDTISFSVDGPSGSPAVFNPREEVVLLEDGTPIVGGIITEAREEGHGTIADDSIITHITAQGFSVYLTYQYYTGTLAAGTLKSMWTTLIALFAVNGITLHGSQVDGPAIAEQSFTRARVDEICNQLCQIAGHTYTINPDKTFRSQAVGIVPAPFDIVDSGDVYQTGDVKVTARLDENYANRITVLITGAEGATSTEAFTTDGLDHGGTTYYVAKYPASQEINTVWPNGIVGIGPIGWGGPPSFGSYEWTWNPMVTPARLEHNDTAYGIWPAGLDFTITYTIRYPYAISVDDLADQALYGVREKIIELPYAMSDEAATEYAQAVLDAGTPLLETVTYQTRTTGLRPGQTQTITVPTRHVDDTFLIQSVRMRVEQEDTGETILHEITAVTGSQVKGQYQQVYKDWLKMGGGKSGGVETAGGGAAPGWPPLSIQYHGPDGEFKGNEYVGVSDQETSTRTGLDIEIVGHYNEICGDGHQIGSDA